MKFWSDFFKDGVNILGEFVFVVMDFKMYVVFFVNCNLYFVWSDLLVGIKLLVLVVYDFDVFLCGDDVNQEGKIVLLELLCVDFYYWMLVDILVGVSEIKVGQFSNGVIVCGKLGLVVLGDVMLGVCQGINDYIGWFVGDGDMCGDYFGYDGFCLLWNDVLVYCYIFMLYVLDVEQLFVVGNLEGLVVVIVLCDYVLDQVFFIGFYIFNFNVVLCS